MLTSLITSPLTSISQPLRASWPTAALCGSPSVHRGTQRISNGWWWQLSVLLDHRCPYSQIFTLTDYKTKPVVFPKSIYTMDTLFSSTALWGKIHDNKNQNKYWKTASTLSCYGHHPWYHNYMCQPLANVEEWDLHCTVFTGFTFYLFLFLSILFIVILFINECVMLALAILEVPNCFSPFTWRNDNKFIFYSVSILTINVLFYRLW